MAKNKYEVESDYITEETTAFYDKKSGEDFNLEIPLESYPSSKPKRIVIRAKIIHDKNQIKKTF